MEERILGKIKEKTMILWLSNPLREYFGKKKLIIGKTKRNEVITVTQQKVGCLLGRKKTENKIKSAEKDKAGGRWQEDTSGEKGPP